MITSSQVRYNSFVVCIIGLSFIGSFKCMKYLEHLGTSMEYNLTSLFGELIVRYIHINLVFLGCGTEYLHIIDVVRPRKYRPFFEGEVSIDNLLFEKCHLCPEAMTGFTGPVGRVE